MKIAISAYGNNLDSIMDERFGRASTFIIYDLENDSYSSINNSQNLNSAQGAGIQTAQNIIKAGVEAVITGNVGPKAFHTLSAADVEIYLTTGLTISEVISRFKEGSLQKTDRNNVNGHW